jgi:hypothetical protein
MFSWWRFSRGTAIATLAMAAVMLASGVASASTLPTVKQATALQKAFSKDTRHPKNAIVVFMKVSKVNAKYAEVGYVVPPKKAAGLVAPGATEPPKIVVIHYERSGLGYDPESGAPPAAVAADLAKDDTIEITFKGDGHEEGTVVDKTPCDDGSNGNVVITGHVYSEFQWTETWSYDGDRPASGLPANPFSGPSLFYQGNAGSPSTGSYTLHESLANNRSACRNGGSPPTVKCTTQKQIVKAGTSISFHQDLQGILRLALSPYFVAMHKPTCTGGGEWEGATRTDAGNGGALVVWMPIADHASTMLTLQSFAEAYDITFPEQMNPESKDRVITSHKSGLCAGSHDSCYDSVEWTGVLRLAEL